MKSELKHHLGTYWSILVVRLWERHWLRVLEDAGGVECFGQCGRDAAGLDFAVLAEKQPIRAMVCWLMQQDPVEEARHLISSPRQSSLVAKMSFQIHKSTGVYFGEPGLTVLDVHPAFLVPTFAELRDRLLAHRDVDQARNRHR